MVLPEFFFFLFFFFSSAGSVSGQYLENASSFKPETWYTSSLGWWVVTYRFLTWSGDWLLICRWLIGIRFRAISWERMKFLTWDFVCQFIVVRTRDLSILDVIGWLVIDLQVIDWKLIYWSVSRKPGIVERNGPYFRTRLPRCNTHLGELWTFPVSATWWQKVALIRQFSISRKRCIVERNGPYFGTRLPRYMFDVGEFWTFPVSATWWQKVAPIRKFSISPKRCVVERNRPYFGTRLPRFMFDLGELWTFPVSATW